MNVYLTPDISLAPKTYPFYDFRVKMDLQNFMEWHLVESIALADGGLLTQYRDNLYERTEADPAYAQTREAKLQRRAIRWSVDMGFADPKVCAAKIRAQEVTELAKAQQAQKEKPKPTFDDGEPKSAYGKHIKALARQLHPEVYEPVPYCPPQPAQQGWTPLFGSGLADFMGGWMLSDHFWNRNK
jgi:hypothetical protein